MLEDGLMRHALLLREHGLLLYRLLLIDVRGLHRQLLKHSSLLLSQDLLLLWLEELLLLRERLRGLLIDYLLLDWLMLVSVLLLLGKLLIDKLLLASLGINLLCLLEALEALTSRLEVCDGLSNLLELLWCLLADLEGLGHLPDLLELLRHLRLPDLLEWLSDLLSNLLVRLGLLSNLLVRLGSVLTNLLERLLPHLLERLSDLLEGLGMLLKGWSLEINALLKPSRDLTMLKTSGRLGCVLLSILSRECGLH